MPTEVQQRIVSELFSNPMAASEVKNRLNEYVLMKYTGPRADTAMNTLHTIGGGVKKVCQRQFKRNDIVWICRSCQKDETCVQCNECYQASNHTGHEVFFYHSHAGGCCDCGDVEAWAQEGFCTKHGQMSPSHDTTIAPEVSSPIKDVFDVLFEELIKHVRLYASTESTPNPNLHADPFEACCIVVQEDGFHSDADIVANLQRMSLLPLNESDIILKIENLRRQGFIEILHGFRSGCEEQLKTIVTLTSLKAYIFSELETSQRDVVLVVISWLTEVAETCDPICKLLCSSLSLVKLQTLMSNDPYLPTCLRSALHRLYITLMSDQDFKYQAAIAYSLSFIDVAQLHATGVGTSENSLFGLSVQFLNRESIVKEISSKYGFLYRLMESLDFLLKIGLREAKLLQHPILLTRRYVQLVGDLKIVFSSVGMSRIFLATCSERLFTCLRRQLLMNAQERAVVAHVEVESKAWVQAFNLDLSMMSSFEYLINWFANQDATSSDLVFHMIPFTLACNDDVLEDVSLPSAYSFMQGIVIELFEFQKELILTTDPITVQAYPAGDITLYFTSEGESFHIGLYRLFSCSIREACRFQHLDTTVQDISNLFHTSNKDTIVMSEILVRVLAFESAIKVGRWRRNGHSMEDQMYNYSDPPFCKAFKDPDVTLLQLCALHLNSTTLLNTMIHFFGVEDFVQWAVFNSAPKSTEFLAGSLDALLLLLINVVTELPLPSYPLSQQDHRHLCTIRQEVVHRLAQSPCSYTELAEHCSALGDIEHVVIASLESLLGEVAVKKQTHDLETAKYHLKDELWGEYDPSFPHLSSAAHQAAMERRPKNSTPTAFAGALPLGHAIFEPLREHILSDTLVLVLIRAVFLTYTATVCQTSPVYAKIAAEFAFKCPENLFLRVLHLVTLVLHLANSHTSLHAVLNSFIMTPSHGDLHFIDIICDLLDSVPKTDKVYCWLEFIINSFEGFDQSHEYIANRFEKIREQTKMKEMEIRRKRARERALQQIQSSAQAFSAEMDDDDEVHTEEAAEASSDSSHTCIVCHQHDDAAMGFMGFCQVSSLMDRPASRTTLHLIDHSHDTSRSASPFVSYCGHSIHLSCFDLFFARSVQMSNTQDNHMFDPAKGQYQCPLCKRLNNILLPIYPRIALPAPPADSGPQLDAFLSLAQESSEEEKEEEKITISPAVSSSPFVAVRRALSSFFNFGAEAIEEMDTTVPASTANNRMSERNIRFLTAFCVGSIHRRPTTWNCIDAILKAVVYSITIEPNTKLLNETLSALRSSLEEVEGPLLLAQNIVDACQGVDADKASLDAFLKRNVSDGNIIDDAVHSWLQSPLLERPLLHTLALALCVCNEAEVFPVINVIAIAALVQIVLSESADASSSRVDMQMEEDNAATSDAGMLVASVVSCLSGYFSLTNATLPVEAINKRWASFLEVSRRLVALVFDSECLPELRYSDEIGRIITVWVKSVSYAMIPSPILSNSHRVYRPPSLIQLPDEYTELHRMVMSMCSYDYPAVCLGCGGVINANGQGLCTRHVAHCFGTAGALFLVQDCSLLLMNDGRCCYFPSPYCDKHGEKHKQFKGRPLYLDQRRYEAISKLWTSHGIPNEVLRIRSSSNRVIIIGHY